MSNTEASSSSKRRRTDVVACTSAESDMPLQVETTSTDSNGLQNLRTRSSPKSLYEGIKVLSPAQQECVKAMGFGRFLSLAVDCIPAMMGFYVVDILDTRRMCLAIPNSIVKIDSQTIHTLTGLPNEGDFFPKEHDPKEALKISKLWRSHYPSLEVSAKEIVNRLKTYDQADWMFRIDFAMLFTATMIDCQKNGKCKMSIIRLLTEDRDISKLNWTSFILSTIWNCKDDWDKKDPKSYFTGPLTILTMLYVDSINCSLMNFQRTTYAMSQWNMKLLKERQAFEIEGGGFGKGVKQPLFVSANDIGCSTRGESLMQDISKSEQIERGDKAVGSAVGGSGSNLLLSGCDVGVCDKEENVVKEGVTEASEQNEILTGAQEYDDFNDFVEDDAPVGPSEKKASFTDCLIDLSSLLEEIKVKKQAFESKMLLARQTHGDKPDLNIADEYKEIFKPDDVRADVNTERFDKAVSVEECEAFRQRQREKAMGKRKISEAGIDGESGDGTGSITPILVKNSSFGPSFSLGLTQEFGVTDDVTPATEIPRVLVGDCDQDNLSDDNIPLSVLVERKYGSVALRSKSKRAKTVSSSLKSPFIMRAVSIDAQVTQEVESVWLYIWRECSDVRELIFEWRKFPKLLVDVERFQSFEPNTMINKYIIECWSVILMNEETRRSPDSPSRMFIGTSILDADTKPDQVPFDDLQRILSKNIVKRSGEDKSLKKIDLIFFPILDVNHYYLLCINLRKPSIMIIDNVALNKKSKKTKTRQMQMATQTKNQLVHYLKSVFHAKSSLLEAQTPQFADVKWATNADIQNSGVYMMRHMETYMGSSSKNWECGFDANISKRKKQLLSLRKNYAAKILLTELNGKRKVVLDTIAGMAGSK